MTGRSRLRHWRRGPGRRQALYRPLDDQLTLELVDRGHDVERQPKAGVVVSTFCLSTTRSMPRSRSWSTTSRRLHITQ